MDGHITEIPPYYDHQLETLRLLGEQDRVLDLSDPGTGKTRPAIGAFVTRRARGGGKCLVLAPKSILQPAWGDDIDRFFPGTTYMCAYATNRKKAFDQDVDIYITNHDAVTWLVKNMPPAYWKDFDTMIVDEFTAYKNPQSARSKAAKALSKHFKYRELMSGTPNPNSITELWHPCLLADDGETLGTRFWQFRSAVCEPVQVGPSANHIQWRDKDGAEHAVYDLIDHMSIRHKFERCQSIPPNKLTDIHFSLPKKVMAQYHEMLNIAATMLDSGKVLTAPHAASVSNKLLQIAAGAVYTDEDKYEVVDTARVELIMDLLDPRPHSLVAFMWKHQRNQLIEAAEKRGYSYAVIDGETNTRDRMQAVEDFQAGRLKVIFCHPKSAGHGLTLTKGTTTILASPTYNSEHYKQLIHRIYRSGQTERTETIRVVASGTIDEKAYQRLDDKLTSMQILLDLLEAA